MVNQKMKFLTKKMVAAELILELEKFGYSVEHLYKWADYIYKNHSDIDPEAMSFLQNLRSMYFGSEFEMSENEIRSQAISLIQEE
ncbi:MAG: hypothetical protein ACRCYZ_04110 [Alphaproteobacteria bacterium]